MGAPRVTPAEIVEMHRLYAELGTYAAVGKAMGRSAGTVSKYGAADKPAVFSQILCKNCTVYGVSGNSVYVCTSKESPHSDIKFKNVVLKRISSLGEYIYPSAGVTFEN